MALVGAPSRFSVLKMDVSDPLERKQPSQPKANAQNNNNNQSSKNSKQQQAKQSKKKKDSNANKKKQNNPQANGGGAQGEKFDEWKKRDEQLMEDIYEKELQEALLRSRIEQEKPEKHVGFSGENGDVKKKGKVTFSLQEFHEKFPDGSPPPPSVHKGEPLAKVLAQRKEQEEEEALRRQSQREASAILAKEKIQQEYLEKSSQPATVTREEYDKMLEMKRKQIEHMARVLNSANKELAILQEQYIDLERVLAKGEMKEKADLIREVVVLQQVKDELTEQIQSLYASLEKERSKNHQLTQELQKRR